MRWLMALMAGGTLLTGCAQPAPSGPYPVQFHCPSYGAFVTSSLGTSVHYAGALAGDPEVCLLRSRSGQNVELVYNWRSNVPPWGDEFRRAMRRLFPLSPGKSVEFARLGQDSQAWRYTITVDALETVTVPAGQFRVWKVTEEERGFGTNIHHSRKTYWIDTESWMPVRAEHDLIAGNWGARPLRSWEAVTVLR